MKDLIHTSIYHDTRRALKNGKYPVKVRVYNPQEPTTKKKLYSTKFIWSKEEFSDCWTKKNPKGKKKEDQKKLQALLNRADEIIDELQSFNWDKFEQKFYRGKKDGISVDYRYEEKIKSLIELERISSAESYESSRKSIIEYLKAKMSNSIHDLTLNDINLNWLNGYKHHMVKIGRSRATIGIYLRCLRHLFHVAAYENEYDMKSYPFGNKTQQFAIPSPRKVKKTLLKEQLTLLSNAQPQNEHQEIAKDFWLFSFQAYGMNLKDIALLKYKDLMDDSFKFYREKTKNTASDDQKPIEVYLNDFTKEIIAKYGKQSKNSEDYIFSIVDRYDSVSTQHSKIKRFTRKLNQHIAILCKENELPKISFYWARHTLAGVSVQNNVPVSFIQEIFGHKDITTTQNYINGFDNDTKKNFSKDILELIKR